MTVLLGNVDKNREGRKLGKVKKRHSSWWAMWSVLV